MMSLDSTVTANALAAAVRAPSPFNTQPWRFIVDGDRISLRLDRRRQPTVADPDAREARLSCGAALCNLRIGLRAQDRVGLVDILPDPSDPDLLATVRVAGERSATASERKLADAIAKRHTNRHPFLERHLPAEARSAMSAAARAEGARLEFVDASERYDLIVDLVRRAERIQDEDGRYQREMQQWLGGSMPHRLYEQRPLLVAVLTPVAGDRYDILAGAGMQRALLTACTFGLSASFVSQPFEVPATCGALTDAFRVDGQVHTLLRIGYGYPGGPTPRRAVEEVTGKP